MSSIAVDVQVTGRVQGVSYRAVCHDQAERLDVAGWVSNEPDGSVRGHFEGSPEAVEGLVAWCRRGPAYASIDAVVVTPGAVTAAGGFSIR